MKHLLKNSIEIVKVGTTKILKKVPSDFARMHHFLSYKKKIFPGEHAPGPPYALGWSEKNQNDKLKKQRVQKVVKWSKYAFYDDFEW